MSACIGIQNFEDIIYHLGETIERNGHQIKFIPNKQNNTIEMWEDGILIKIIG